MTYENVFSVNIFYDDLRIPADLDVEVTLSW